MITVKFVCVGKMREKFYIDAFGEYEKRLRGYCKFECIELTEQRLSDNPSHKEIENALNREAQDIAKQIGDNSLLICMCIEGTMLSSDKLASMIMDKTSAGVSKIIFIIGGSYGLSDTIKSRASFKLSMSPMTFPHHLARVMLAEQVYRSFKIAEGSKYHK